MLRTSILSVAFSLLCIGHAFSQAQITSADLKGTITDTSGAVLPGATVTITNTERGTTRVLQSDSQGQYLALLLPPAVNYEVRAELPGFATQIKRGITLTVGEVAIIDFRMEVTGTATEIIVTSATPIVETERIQQANFINERQINALPINGRNFLDFSLLVPGVTSQNPLTNSGLPQLPASGLSFGGQSGRNNSVTIDGADNNEASGATVRNTLSQEAIQEFQINRSNFSAEFGRSSGGLINIVTKSGTNTPSGSLFFYWRDNSLDARNAFAFGPGLSDIDPAFSRIQYGASIGGPIVKGKSFYFATFERLDRTESLFLPFNQNPTVFAPTAGQSALIGGIATLPPSADIPLPTALAGALTSALTMGPTSRARRLLDQESGVKPFYSEFTTASVRWDHTFGSNNQFNARFNWTDTLDLGFVVANLRARTNGANNDSLDTGLVLSDTHIFSSRVVNEARFQFANRDFNSIPVDRNGPSLAIAGIGDFGRNFNIDSLRNEKRFQWVDNLTLNYGNHRMKLGVDFNHLRISSDTEIFFGGVFNFGQDIPLPAVYPNIVAGLNAQLPPAARVSPDFVKLITQLSINGKSALVPQVVAALTPLQTFNLGVPRVYQQGFGNPSIAITSNQIAFYVHDSIKLSKTFTLEAGLRYDLELHTEGIHRDKNNWAPRLGFSWDPAGRRKTVVRGGFGLYYSPLYEAVTFISKVLSQETGIFQVFVPATGTPFLPPATNSISIYQTLLAQGFILTPDGQVGPRKIAANHLAPFGITPRANAPFSVVFATDPTIENPYSAQASFGIDQQLHSDWALSANYIFNKGNKALRLRDINVARTSVHPDLGIPIFSRLNPLLLQVNMVESSGSSVYHGGTLELKKRFSRNYGLSVAYTLSKAIDTATDILLNFKPNNNDDVRSERGLSLFDQRQRFVISGLLQTPFQRGPGNPWLGRLFADITMAPILTVGSGRPWNLELSYDANGDTQNTDRPFLVTAGKPAVYAGRNTGIGPDYINFDLRIGKQLRFTERVGAELLFEAFNLFNRVNYSGVNNIVPSETLIIPDASQALGFRSLVRPVQLSTFRVEAGGGRVTDFSGFTAAFAPRQIQLALRFRF